MVFFLERVFVLVSWGQKKEIRFLVLGFGTWLSLTHSTHSLLLLLLLLLLLRAFLDAFPIFFYEIQTVVWIFVLEGIDDPETCEFARVKKFTITFSVYFFLRKNPN